MNSTYFMQVLLLQVGEQQKMKIQCNECGAIFKNTRIKIRKEKITNSIIRYYYTCPKCKFKYVISYEDDEIRENIKRIKELDREAANATDNNEIVNLMKKRNNLKNRNLEKSDQYMVVFKGIQYE